MERHAVSESSSADAKAAAKEARHLEILSRHGSGKALEEAAELLSQSTNKTYLNGVNGDLKAYDRTHKYLPQVSLYDSEIEQYVAEPRPFQVNFRQADVVVRQDVQTKQGPAERDEWAIGDSYQDLRGRKFTDGALYTSTTPLDQLDPPPSPKRSSSS